MDRDKKEEEKAGSSHDAEKDKRHEDRSLSRSSGSYSSVELEREEKKSEPTIHHGTRKMRPVRKKSRRAVGRVQKRRKPKKAIKRKPRVKLERPVSVTSFYTSRQSISPGRQVRCKHCGHRCCLRRFEHENRRLAKFKRRRLAKDFQKRRVNRLDKRKVQKFEQRNFKRKPKSRQLKRKSVSEQVGSPCLMLSKLLVSASSAPAPPEERLTYSQITPHMIHQSLRVLTMWQQGVPTDAIYNYIRRNYPVNPNPNEVMMDLLEKLRVASIAGIVWALPNDHWRLTCELERMNKIDKTHVTLFWKAYGDTLKPLDKNLQPSLKLSRENKQAGTDESLRIEDDDNTNTII